MNHGMEGLMTIQGTHVVHGTPEPNFNLNNISTPSTSQVNTNNDMMTPLGGEGGEYRGCGECFFIGKDLNDVVRGWYKHYRGEFDF